MSAQRILPGPGQESVWDYPRPPRLETATRRVRVIFAGETIADSSRAVRILETASPPTYYIPAPDVRMDVLRPARDSRTTRCEWKGRASYFDVELNGTRSERAAWTYEEPKKEFESIAGWIAFYPARVDACYLDEENVRTQAGGFYGGWITDDVVGPFKGEPGSEEW